MNPAEDQVRKLHTYTAQLTPPQADKLRTVLQSHGFRLETKPHALYAARKDKLNVTVYEKGPKALIQGRGIEDFISFVLEPEVLGEARFGYEEVHSPELFSPHFGIDESGKGDFFGPLVIAGVYVDRELALEFQRLGITDSKRITSDKRIRDFAKAIRGSGAPQSVVAIRPERYNELFRKIGNLNRLLAWGHARVIEDLCALRPDCPRALSDQFANPTVLKRALMEKGRGINLEQRTKAESDFAVAAASILARERLIDWFDASTRELGMSHPFPRGASSAVKTYGAELIRRHGPDILPKVAKTHFKTAAEITG